MKTRNLLLLEILDIESRGNKVHHVEFKPPIKPIPTYVLETGEKIESKLGLTKEEINLQVDDLRQEWDRAVLD